MSEQLYEIYEVPNDELDGTEQFINEFNTLDEAEECKIKMIHNFPLWIILANDEQGYIKVVSNG